MVSSFQFQETFWPALDNTIISTYKTSGVPPVVFIQVTNYWGCKTKIGMGSIKVWCRRSVACVWSSDHSLTLMSLPVTIDLVELASSKMVILLQGPVGYC